MGKKEFIARVSIVAKEGYIKYSILPSLTIAQAILESSWGEKHIGNNIFGIKAGKSWTGKVAIRETKEWNGTRYIITEARFRAYDSFEDSTRDYLKLIGQSKRYEKVKKARDYKEASRLIYEAGYATDPKYSEKLINIIETNKLYQYDRLSDPVDSISDWAVEAWNWAIGKGITDGKNPKDYLTREQGITMLYRFYKNKGS